MEDKTTISDKLEEISSATNLKELIEQFELLISIPDRIEKIPVNFDVEGTPVKFKIQPVYNTHLHFGYHVYENLKVDDNLKKELFNNHPKYLEKDGKIYNFKEITDDGYHWIEISKVEPIKI